MNTKKTETAEEAWDKYRKLIAGRYLASFEGVEFPYKSFQQNFDWAQCEGFKDGHKKGISDYRASLREAIEKEITTLEVDEDEFSDEEVHFAMSTLRKVLQLLDTVTPPKN